MNTKPENTTAAATAAPSVAIAAPGIPVGIPLDAPIQRTGQTITHVQVRKPNAGALRGLSLVEVLQMNVTALQALLPRVTEPPLLRQEVDAMDPADLVALGSEVVGFLVPKAQREGFQAT
ncbi:MAG: phage tail assembly protein [Acidovorax temperans]|uniref:phage tail assembly protein n=1 Tax=Acidovorax temperans TaxID=80878 RepID=UPI00391B1B3A